MRINNKSTFKTIKKYLSSYRNIFYKRSFEIFILIIISIITTQKIQSIKFIYENFISKFWNYSLREIMRITTKITILLIFSKYIKI